MTPGSGGWSAVLFDLDGTLADTVDLILRCFRHTMEVHGREAPPDEEWLATIGTPLREQFKRHARDAEEVRRLTDTYSAYQSLIHDDLVEPFPQAVEVVTALRAAGTPVAVVTSKRTVMARRTLARCGLEGAFEVVVGADDVTQAKPHPEPVLLALSLLGQSHGASRTLFVGDSPFDIRAGRAAGVRTAAALWGPFAREVLEREAPDYLLNSPEEVLGLELRGRP